MTFPLPLRNALAELAIAALDDEHATAALVWLATPAGDLPPPAAARLSAAHLTDGRRLLDIHAPHTAAIAAHATRALRAVAGHRPATSGEAVERAACAAIALWNERLFFEVHEVLEAVWKTASGATRQALQGVIQIAVAYHHLAHGNLRGARTLLSEGRARIVGARETRLDPIDLDDLLASTASWEAALAGRATLPEHPPQLKFRR